MRAVGCACWFVIGFAALAGACSSDESGSGSGGSAGAAASGGSGGGAAGGASGAGGAGGASGSGATGGTAGVAGGGAGPSAIEGYGATSVGGEGGDECHVTSLADSGAGTLRDCIVNRSSARRVVFDVAGEITLATDLVVNQPYLTVDGATAPAPGITIVKGDIQEGQFIIAGTHDVIVRHLRFMGLWQTGGPHLNNAATIAIDGDANPDHVAARIVLDHVTSRNATDGGPDIWGEVRDVTIQWSFFFHSWHPTTISHYPAPYQVRQRISMHHNLYAKNGERNPQIRADVRDLDYVNNVVYDWGFFGEGAGYGVRVRNEAGEPKVNANIVANAFVPGAVRPGWALVFGDVPGADASDGGPAGAPAEGTVVTTTLLGELWVSGNILPPENQDQYSTIAQPLPVPPAAEVTTYPATALRDQMLPYVGMLYRSAEEEAIVAELAAKL